MNAAIMSEELVYLDDAAHRLVPKVRGGKATAPSTLFRWITRGVTTPDGKRIRLEAVRLGGRWATSKEALDRFVMAMTAAYSGGDPLPAPRPPTQQRAAATKAGRQLETMGA